VKFLRAFWMAVGTFSIFPAPHMKWDDESRKYMICFLPAVGILPGAALFLWFHLCVRFSLPSVLFSAVAAVLPLILTGGIHMDGFMDTWDAIGSHQPKEKKLEIMKDSHAGAFAVMSCAVYLLLLFALYDTAGTAFPAVTVSLGFLLSRALAGIGTIVLPNARGSGMLAHLQGKQNKGKMLLSLLLLSAVCAVCMILSSLLPGALAVGLALIWFLCFCLFSRKTFGGITGDITGFCIQMTEFWILLGTVIGGLIR